MHGRNVESDFLSGSGYAQARSPNNHKKKFASTTHNIPRTIKSMQLPPSYQNSHLAQLEIALFATLCESKLSSLPSVSTKIWSCLAIRGPIGRFTLLHSGDHRPGPRDELPSIPYINRSSEF